jgi:hypothetical protein
MSIDRFGTTSVTTKVGVNGRVAIRNQGPTSDIVVDIVGWYLANADFTPVSPTRIIDSRKSSFEGPLNGSETRNYKVLGVGQVPNVGVTSVVLNVTAISSSSVGYLTVWPTGQARPTSESLVQYWVSPVSNTVTSLVGANGMVSIYSNVRGVDFTIDVVGWFSSNSVFTTLPNRRILDAKVSPSTFDGQNRIIGKVKKGATTSVVVAGRAGVPATGVGSVVLNVTVANPTAPVAISVWPVLGGAPAKPTIDGGWMTWRMTQITTKVGAGGKVNIASLNSDVYLSVDVVGWYSNQVVSAPGAPSSVGVQEADRSLEVSWASSERNGGSPITAYTATAKPSNQSCTVSSTSSNCRISNLAYGETQTVTVTATSRIGLTSRSSSPASGTPYAVTSVEIGEFAACGVVSNGRVACWGPNADIHGRGGRGSVNYREGINWVFTSSNVPLEGVKQVSVSEHHGCAVLTNGHVYCWGTNTSGEVGTQPLRDGSLVSAPFATEVSPAISDAVSVFVMTDGLYSYGSSCAVRAGGTVVCWGSNLMGQIGFDSSQREIPGPTEMAGISGVSKLSSNGLTTCVIATGSAVKCVGELIPGGVRPRGSLVFTMTPYSSGVTDLAVGLGGNLGGGWWFDSNLCAVKDGTTSCIGALNRNSGVIELSSPAAIASPTGAQKLAQAGGPTNCSLAQGGAVWCWGDNTYGVLQDGTTMDNQDSTAVPGIPLSMHVAVAYAEVCVVPIGGGYRCWGGWSDSL